MDNICPICKTSLNAGQETGGDSNFFDCPRCGKYILSRSLSNDLPGILKDKEKIPLLSHVIWKMQGKKDIPILNSYMLELILKTELPSLTEQINNLILWLGDTSIPGDNIVLPLERFQTIIGAKTARNFLLVVSHLRKRELLDEEQLSGGMGMRIKLTMEGWQYYDNIKRGAMTSRKGFMAMKFGDPDLNWVFENCFKMAVKAAGFELYRLDEKPQAGLIDDRLRVEIRTSRFLISDLTHENAGAYWEAGFAEGLGKPVIYTCEKQKFETQKTHFDTNHHLTIVWEKEKPEEAIQALKNTIRATLPDEAKLTDDE